MFGVIVQQVSAEPARWNPIGWFPGSADAVELYFLFCRDLQLQAALCWTGRSLFT